MIMIQVINTRDEAIITLIKRGANRWDYYHYNYYARELNTHNVIKGLLHIDRHFHKIIYHL